MAMKAWIIVTQAERRITAVEMKFLRRLLAIAFSITGEMSQ